MRVWHLFGLKVQQKFRRLASLTAFGLSTHLLVPKQYLLLLMCWMSMLACNLMRKVFFIWHQEIFVRKSPSEPWYVLSNRAKVFPSEEACLIGACGLQFSCFYLQALRRARGVGRRERRRDCGSIRGVLEWVGGKAKFASCPHSSCVYAALRRCGGKGEKSTSEYLYSFARSYVFECSSCLLAG